MDELPAQFGPAHNAGEPAAGPIGDGAAQMDAAQMDILTDLPAGADAQQSPDGTGARATSEAAGAVAPPLALYRRYRPDTFAELIGQEHVTEPLQRALLNNKVNHAYLFSGPRGCGKTTSARILARALNCATGPAAEPCGRCQSCKDLATGGPGSIDVIEIDAASHGGVDDARDLRERAFFAPVQSRYKVYVIDEAHMVTSAGFNALLRLVEEPPPHVKFVFATTEPDKVIGTIRSRTHHYPFRLVPPRLLADYLATVCDSEGIDVEGGVLPLVVRAGAGSVRDSLSVLDQLLGAAGERGVSYRQAAALLGYTPDSLLDEMLDAIAAGDAAGVFRGVDKVIEVGQDPRRFGEDLLRRVRDLVIVASVEDALSSGLLDVADDQAERLSSQAATLGLGELTRAGEVLSEGLTQMRGTTAPRLHLELMCARVLLPATDLDDRGVHARLERLERRVGMTATGAAAGEHPESTTASESSKHTTESSQAAVQHEEPTPTAGAAATSWPEERAQPAANPDDRPTPAPPYAPDTFSHRPHPAPDDAGGRSSTADSTEQVSRRPAELTLTDLRRLWPQVLEEVKQRKRVPWMVLSQNAHVADVRQGTLLLAMANGGARDMLTRGGNEDVLHAALVAATGSDLAVETMVDAGAGDDTRAESTAGTPAAGRPAAQQPPQRPSSPPADEQPAAPLASATTAETPKTTRAPSDTSPGQAGSEPPPPWDRSDASASPDDDGASGDDWTVRDAAAHRDDAIVDESAESQTELLQRRLGAEVINDAGRGV